MSLGRIVVKLYNGNNPPEYCVKDGKWSFRSVDEAQELADNLSEKFLQYNYVVEIEK